MYRHNNTIINVYIIPVNIFFLLAHGLYRFKVTLPGMHYHNISFKEQVGLV